MKPLDLDKLAAEAVNRNLPTLGNFVKDYKIKPIVERVGFIFTKVQCGLIKAVLDQYLKMLEVDEDAPKDFVTIVGKLTWAFDVSKAQFSYAYGVPTKQFMLDTNEFHIIEKALRISTEIYVTLKQRVPDELRAMQKHFTEGKPL